MCYITTEDQLLEKQRLEAVNHIKNVSKKRVTTDYLLNCVKLCILRCERTIDHNLRLQEMKKIRLIIRILIYVYHP